MRLRAGLQVQVDVVHVDQVHRVGRQLDEPVVGDDDPVGGHRVRGELVHAAGGEDGDTEGSTGQTSDRETPPFGDCLLRILGWSFDQQCPKSGG